MGPRRDEADNAHAENAGTGAAGVSRRAAVGGVTAAVLGAAGLARGAVAAPVQATPPAEAATVPADFKVVLHASDPTHWPYVLSNLTNLAQQWPRAQIRVVVDGTAVYGLQGVTDITTKLAPFAARGVALEVCPNALHEHGIDPRTMPPYARVTLGGVVALVAAQRAGYAYVKP